MAQGSLTNVAIELEWPRQARLQCTGSVWWIRKHNWTLSSIWL